MKRLLSTLEDLKTSPTVGKTYSFEEMKAEWDRHAKWRKDHWVFARCEDVYDFFRYTIPRVSVDWKQEVRWAWQRVFRGYDDVFVWNLHNEHTKLMLKVLKDFRKHHVGSPIIRKKDWLSKKEDPKDNVHTFWDKQLEIMIDGFQAQKDIEDMEYADLSRREQKRKHKDLIARWENGMKAFVKHYNGLWD